MRMNEIKRERENLCLFILGVFERKKQTKKGEKKMRANH